MSVAAFAAVVHLISDFEYLPDAVRGQVRASLHQRNDLLELMKVSFLLWPTETGTFQRKGSRSRRRR